MKVNLYGKGDCRGIYKITNTQNNRIYFGSTGRLRKRAFEHKKSLEENKHQNIFLQNDWNKCGPDYFTYDVVETVDGDKEELLRREQHFLDMFFDKNKKCYNLCPIAGSREGTKNSRPYNPETDGRHTSRTPEVIAVVSAKNKKIWNTSEKKEEASQHAHKRWDKHSAGVTVSNKETGETTTIEGSIRAWCEARNLSYKSFHLMVQGKTKSSSGWFLGTEAPFYVERKGEKRKPLSEKSKTSHSSHQWEGVVVENFITKQQVVLGKNIKSDCNDSLNYHALRRLLQGNNLYTQNGWHLSDKKELVRKEVFGSCEKCGVLFGSETGMKNHERKNHKLV